MIVSFTCKHCGLECTVVRAASQSHPKYCSFACRGAYKQRPRVIKERFWRRVDVRGENECWLWTGSLDKDGYGKFAYYRLSKVRHVRAHWFSYRVSVGRVPKGLSICHTCDVPTCCNPAHLWIGTNTENTSDRNQKSRQARGSRDGNARLSEIDIPIIRRLLSEGLTCRRIGQIFGVAENTIGHIKRGETWRHI
jgi:hypothetical protein